MQIPYYTIGEVAKLANISIQTLRYYDQIDLFKPSYVDSVTNYRYYKDSQLFYLDLIKSLKSLGTPLEKIKEAQQLTPQQLVTFLSEQEQALARKMQQLASIQDNLYKTKRQMEEQLAIDQYEVVYKKQEEKTRILKVHTTDLTARHIPSSYYSSLKKTVENAGNVFTSRYGGIFPLKNYTSIDDLYYDALFTPLLSKITTTPLSNELQFAAMPAGTYLCIAFLFDEEAYITHYRTLYNYIERHSIAVYHDVYEIFMPTNYSPMREDEFIVELKIRCQPLL